MNLYVTSKSGAQIGSACLGDRIFPCALGKAGIVSVKKEGDHATPLGSFPVREILFRADRIEPPNSNLPLTPIQEQDGWCDDPIDAFYNKKVRLPYAARHEKLWREDSIYNLILVIGYNDDPIIPFAGSAVFVHIARPDFSPTEGCIAFKESDLREILYSFSSKDYIDIRTE